MLPPTSSAHACAKRRWACERVGTEEVAGRAAEVWEFTSESEDQTVWVDETTGFPLRFMAAVEGEPPTWFETTLLEPGPQPAELLSLGGYSGPENEPDQEFNPTAPDTRDCAQLLEGLDADTTVALPDFRTMEARISLTMPEGVFGVGTSELDAYLVVDRVGRRVYMKNRVPEMSVTFVTRLVDGQASSITRFDDGEEWHDPAPEAEVAMLERLLEGDLAQLERLFSDGAGLPSALSELNLSEVLEVVSCDGFRSYADLIAGEQVTVRVKPSEQPSAEVAMRFLFGPEGEPKGFFVDEGSSGTGPGLLVTSALAVDAQGFPVQGTMGTYQLEGEQATLAIRAHVDYRFNEPVDEALFLP